MWCLKNNKGLTLVEMVIAVAILGGICVAFLGMQANGVNGINYAGQYSQAEYKVQEAMEQRIANITVAATSEMTPVTVSGKVVNINFPGGISISTTGRLEKVIYNDGSHNVELSTFIPNP